MEIAKSFGINLLNLNSAHVDIAGFRLRKVFEKIDTLGGIMWNHYRAKLMNQFLAVVGALDIIGSPYNLVVDVGNG